MWRDKGKPRFIYKRQDWPKYQNTGVTKDWKIKRNELWRVFCLQQTIAGADKQGAWEFLGEWRDCLGAGWQTQWDSEPLNDTFIKEADVSQILDELLPRTLPSVAKSKPRV